MTDHRLFRHAQIGLALLLLSSTTFSSAEGDTHYRWTNERGGTVYSDRPPAFGVDYEVVSSGTGLKRIVDGDEGAVPLEVNPTPGNDFDQVDTRNESATEKNDVLCEKARMNLIALEDADVVNIRDKEGEVKALSPGEREIAKQTAAAHISVYCR
ncbi:MAG: DUF4124 domain-containing protein [Halioglobus sp.]